MGNERKLQNCEIPSMDVMVSRNLAVAAMAMADSGVYERGYNWYPIEHDNICKLRQDLRADIGVDVSQGTYSKVVSIVSPGRKWKYNLKDAYATILAHTVTPDIEERSAILSDWKVGRRYGLPMFQRAWDLLDGKYELVYKKQPKTYGFADNLEYPETTKAVVVDQHNCHILLGEQQELGGTTILGSIGISVAQYRPLEKSIRIAADYVNMPHHKFQSLIWQWRVENAEVQG